MINDLQLWKQPVQKQITFDLSELELQKHYPRCGKRLDSRFYKKAWSDIGKFMRRNGFLHRQYSVYISERALTEIDINTLIRGMVENLPWTYKCFIAIDVTDIGEQYELLPVMENYAIGME
ncbi:MAG: hypothetical protein LUI10_13130 [Lachnospiraceae bacterium]|nr:hypothetical protein [Lachnospiraceae bacterium]